METSARSMDTLSEKRSKPTEGVTAKPARGEGYLSFVGHLQILAGSLSILFSLFGIGFAVNAGETQWLNPLAVYEFYAANETGVAMLKLLSAYVSLQVALGWAFGLLLIAGGMCCLKPKCRGLVATAAIINLINFPHGTTVGILALHGFTRPNIRSAFRK